MLDCISEATGTRDKFHGLPLGGHAVQIADGTTTDYFLRTFGRSTRETVCTCAVSLEPNLSQALELINGDTVQNKITGGAQVKKLIDAKMDDKSLLTNLYLRTLGRAPTDDELKTLMPLRGRPIDAAGETRGYFLGAAELEGVHVQSLMKIRNSKFEIRRLAAAPFLVFLLAISTLRADVTYEENIRPILQDSCLNCHNPDKKKAGLDLSTYDAAMEGSDNGQVIEAGDPDKSLLYQVITHAAEPYMPKGGDKIADAQIDMIRQWIQANAPDKPGGMMAGANTGPEVAAAPVDEKPQGPPAMPRDGLLEPVVHTRRTGAVPRVAGSPWAPLVAIAAQKQVLLYNTDTLELASRAAVSRGFPRRGPLQPQWQPGHRRRRHRRKAGSCGDLGCRHRAGASRRSAMNSTPCSPPTSARTRASSRSAAPAGSSRSSPPPMAR